MLLQVRQSSVYFGLQLRLVRSEDMRYFLYFIHSDRWKVYLISPGRVVYLFSETGPWFSDIEMAVHMYDVAKSYAERLK